MGLLSWLFGKKKKEAAKPEPEITPVKASEPSPAPVAQEKAVEPAPAPVAQEKTVEPAPAPVAQEKAVEPAPVPEEKEEAPAMEAAPVEEKQEAPAEKKRAAILVGNNLMVTEDGEDHTLEGFRNYWVYMDNEAFKVSGVNASVTAKEPGTYYQTITGKGVVENAKGEDVTAQFRITTKPGILVILPKTE